MRVQFLIQYLYTNITRTHNCTYSVCTSEYTNGCIGKIFIKMSAHTFYTIHISAYIYFIRLDLSCTIDGWLGGTIDMGEWRSHLPRLRKLREELQSVCRIPGEAWELLSLPRVHLHVFIDSPPIRLHPSDK